MPHKISFKHALNGIVYCFKTQPNFRVHIFMAILVIFSGLFLQVSSTQLIILLFTITMVITAEMINTSLESMTDLITNKYASEAKIAKDVAAGMVLATATMSIVVGLVIFLPHVLRLISSL